jgi:hypothetical protein
LWCFTGRTLREAGFLPLAIASINVKTTSTFYGKESSGWRTPFTAATLKAS